MYNFSQWLYLQSVVICSLEFIIIYMECLFYKIFNKHITFQSDLKINNIPNWVILEEIITIINGFQAFYNSLFVSRSLTVIIWFNSYNSSTITFFSIISLWKVLIILQKELVKKEVLVEELQASNQILFLNERHTNNGLKKTRKILINVSFFSNMT